MDKTRAVLGSVVFLVVAPGTVAGLVPRLISRWQIGAPSPGSWLLRPLAIALIAAGAAVLLESFARFAVQGLGTPAPICPTERLIVTGSYRFVRNPMYLAVLAVIAGQAALFGGIALPVYGALVWLAFHLFVLTYEEPRLRRTFPDDYRAYFGNVGRWLPRLTPWQQPS